MVLTYLPGEGLGFSNQNRKAVYPMGRTKAAKAKWPQREGFWREGVTWQLEVKPVVLMQFIRPLNSSLQNLLSKPIKKAFSIISEFNTIAYKLIDSWLLTFTIHFTLGMKSIIYKLRIFQLSFVIFHQRYWHKLPGHLSIASCDISNFWKMRNHNRTTTNLLKCKAYPQWST